jgi:hypothetical protein
MPHEVALAHFGVYSSLVWEMPLAKGVKML